MSEVPPDLPSFGWLARWLYAVDPEGPVAVLTANFVVTLATYAAAARAAGDAGLGVNAGHDLNQQNLPAFLSVVPGVLEVSIGHALIADALDDGLAQTVRNYLAAMARAQ